MYKEAKIVDRREMLRVKAKSLAAEARIIRKEELRTRGDLREELYLHRIHTVRRAARSTHIALSFIRGKTLAQIEPKSFTEPDWASIATMLRKYGQVVDPGSGTYWSEVPAQHRYAVPVRTSLQGRAVYVNVKA